MKGLMAGEKVKKPFFRALQEIHPILLIDLKYVSIDVKKGEVTLLYEEERNADLRHTQTQRNV